MPKLLAKFKLSEKLGGTLFIKNCSAEQQCLQEPKTLQQNYFDRIFSRSC